MPRCGCCRSRSARRCSRSMPSAARSTTSSTTARADARRTPRGARRLARATSTPSTPAAQPAAGRVPRARSCALRSAARGFPGRDRRHADGRWTGHPRAGPGRARPLLRPGGQRRRAGCRSRCSAWTTGRDRAGLPPRPRAAADQHPARSGRGRRASAGSICRASSADGRHRRATSRPRCCRSRASTRPAAELAALARSAFRRGRRGDGARPARPMAAPRLMGAVYRAILGGWTRAGWAPPRERVPTSPRSRCSGSRCARPADERPSRSPCRRRRPGRARGRRAAGRGRRRGRAARGRGPGGRALPLLFRRRRSAAHRQRQSPGAVGQPGGDRYLAPDRRGGRAGRARPDAVFASSICADGERWTLRPNAGRLPWWMFAAARRVPGTRPADYLAPALCRAPGRRARSPTYSTGRGALYRRRLMAPLAGGGAQHRAGRRLGGARRGRAARDAWRRAGGPTARWSPARACRRLRRSGAAPGSARQGARAALGPRLRRDRVRDGRASALDFDDGTRRCRGDAVILAVPAPVAARAAAGARPRPTSSAPSSTRISGMAPPAGAAALRRADRRHGGVDLRLPGRALRHHQRRRPAGGRAGRRPSPHGCGPRCGAPMIWRAEAAGLADRQGEARHLRRHPGAGAPPAAHDTRWREPDARRRLDRYRLAGDDRGRDPLGRCRCCAPAGGRRGLGGRNGGAGRARALDVVSASSRSTRPVAPAQS